MRLDEVLERIPQGKFRVFGRDNFDETYFVIDDYEQEHEDIARIKEKEEKQLNGENNEIATTFYVVDSKLNFYYGILPRIK